ncbi:MAG: hypothetical protein H0U59_09640 [Gemmatimonadaceae bacterium]|nr:hypothetical protein [Gemmatimonadaceae bacterium]
MKTISASRCVNVLLLAGSILGTRIVPAQTRTVEPVLGFPEAGLDDPAAYQGYQTRFFRDAGGNAVQVYLDARTGRAVTVMADAVNESVGFTVRDGDGKPLRLEWGSGTANITRSGSRRSIEYQLVAESPRIRIGLILLGSMRVERDLVYSGRHLKTYALPVFPIRELNEMMVNLGRLAPDERNRQLGLLNVRGLPDLRRRMQPTFTSTVSGPRRSVSVAQTAFDGKTHLELELSIDPREATIVTGAQTVSIRAVSSRQIRFSVRVTTDAASLTPLARNEIFNAAFLRFADSARASADRVTTSAGAQTSADSGVISRSRRLERDMRSVELLSAREKLMAGMPNYATYFGRDMMMTALMMEPVWSDAMAEHVIASVLRKLGPAGDVSHEEALGGQAIRENAAEYNARLAKYFQARRSGNRVVADSALTQARALLANLQLVRENYNMLDDEFQLPVLAARYLGNPSVPAARKRAFLADSSDGRGPRVELLLKELRLVAAMAAPYAREPVVENLVASPRQDSTHWRSVSWRDSGAGYANGRFAMDINAIWVPRALESISTILGSLKELGFAPDRLNDPTAGGNANALAAFARDPESLRRAVESWNGAARHFVVSLSSDEVRTRVQAKLRSLPASEMAYWQRAIAATAADRQPLEFLAISLDASGRPIPVVNSDPATGLFLHDGGASNGPVDRDKAVRDVRSFLRTYPVGLFVDSLGPVVASDAYATPQVWDAFRRDTYHSPRVVWGREVNLIMLGLIKQITSAVDASGRPRDPSLAPYVQEMRDALRRATGAVDASALKHQELWSYEIEGRRLVPIRYGASTDIQLWNVTALAVQFALSQLPR